MTRQYVITATQTFTFYKTVHAENIADAHLQAHEKPEDSQDDWTCYWDSDYDDPTPENGEFVITDIEDEGWAESDDDYDPTPQYLYDNTNGEPPISWKERQDAEQKRCEEQF